MQTGEIQKYSNLVAVLCIWDIFMKKKSILFQKRSHFHFKEEYQRAKLSYLMYKCTAARILLPYSLLLVRHFVWLSGFLQCFVSQSCLFFIKISTCQFKAFRSQSVVNASVYYETFLPFNAVNEYVPMTFKWTGASAHFQNYFIWKHFHL